MEFKHGDRVLVTGTTLGTRDWDTVDAEGLVGTIDLESPRRRRGGAYSVRMDNDPGFDSQDGMWYVNTEHLTLFHEDNRTVARTLLRRL